MTIICPDKANSTVHLPFHILRLSPLCSATSNYFHLPPTLWESLYGNKCIPRYCQHYCYQHFNPRLRIWQHFSRNVTQPYLLKLKNIPEVPVTQLYRDMNNASEPIHSFTVKDDDEDSCLIWTIIKHPGTYIGTISMVFVLGIDIFCFRF